MFSAELHAFSSSFQTSLDNGQRAAATEDLPGNAALSALWRDLAIVTRASFTCRRRQRYLRKRSLIPVSACRPSPSSISSPNYTVAVFPQNVPMHSRETIMLPASLESANRGFETSRRAYVTAETANASEIATKPLHEILDSICIFRCIVPRQDVTSLVKRHAASIARDGINWLRQAVSRRKTSSMFSEKNRSCHCSHLAFEILSSRCIKMQIKTLQVHLVEPHQGAATRDYRDSLPSAIERVAFAFRSTSCLLR